ncbi:MAG: phosphate butyryltransferase [Erysipelotrichaceae bacterium]|nr:MAG: phosphate [Erysipelotrichaceae bacterium]TXT18185.1 MAG: phosphate butyryltransferase [Erysipelotrichaceae bacterium]
MNLQETLRQRIKTHQKTVLAVACAADEEVISAVTQAVSEHYVSAILVGDEALIKDISSQHHFSLEGIRIINELDPVLACELAVKLVFNHEADLLMKGLVDTSVLLRAVLNKEWGLRTDHLLSHVTVFTVPTVDKMFLMSDGAMNIAPDVNAKKQIIENCIPVTSALGINNPKVAVICAVEKINPKMQATLDAEELSALQKAGAIIGCEVDGPFAFDGAVSIEAAHHKGMSNPNAGKADVLLMPNIEAGNILYKAITYFAQGSVACVISGAAAPIVLTSRSDSDEAKFNSILLAILMAQHKGVQHA